MVCMPRVPGRVQRLRDVVDAVGDVVDASPRLAMKRPIGESSPAPASARSPCRRCGTSPLHPVLLRDPAMRDLEPEDLLIELDRGVQVFTARPRWEIRRSIVSPYRVTRHRNRRVTGSVVVRCRPGPRSSACRPDLPHHLPARGVEVVRHARDADLHVLSCMTVSAVGRIVKVAAGCRLVVDDSGDRLEVERDRLVDVGDGPSRHDAQVREVLPPVPRGTSRWPRSDRRHSGRTLRRPRRSRTPTSCSALSGHVTGTRVVHSVSSWDAFV